LDAKDLEIRDSQWIWVTEFTELAVRDFTEEIFFRFKENPYRPLMINIDSGGGSVYGVLGMLDALDALRRLAPEEFKVITSTTTKAMSAGALLLSHGDIRFASQNATLMVHKVVSSPGWDLPMDDLRNSVNEIERLNKKVLTILRKNCKIKKSVAALDKQLAQDYFMDADQAVEFGLIDGVGLPVVNQVTMFDVSVGGGKK